MSLPPVSSGMRSMALGAFYFSLMSLFVKLVGQRIPNQEIVFFRGLLTLAFTWGLLRRAGVAPFGVRRGMLVWRGVLGFLALTCFYYSIVNLPLAEATVLQYMNPLWAALFGTLFLAERMRKREVALVAASLCGVIVIARPAVLFGGVIDPLDPVAVTAGLLGAVLSGAAYVVIRRLSSTEHPLVIVFYFPLVVVPVSLPGAVASFVWPEPRDLLFLLAMGVTGQVGQIYITNGLQQEPAGRATAAGFLQVVFAGAWGILFFAEMPDLWTFMGAAVILTCTLALAFDRSGGLDEPTEALGVTGAKGDGAERP
ncbi:MAG: DMT family transporter [Gemmatimonadota bacterium]